MRLPAKRRRLLRQYERVIFYSDHSRPRRVYALYLLLRPILGWFYKELCALGLEQYEAESEIYILVDRLHGSFNSKKSSIIPYLERYIPWKTADTLERLRGKPHIEVPLDGQEETLYNLSNEIYLSIPNVLFEDKWLLRGLQRSEKYLIFLMLSGDADELTQARLAHRAGIGRKKMRTMLNNLQETLLYGGYYG